MVDFEKIVLDKLFANNSEIECEWDNWDIKQKRNSLHSHIKNIAISVGNIEIQWRFCEFRTETKRNTC